MSEKRVMRGRMIACLLCGPSVTRTNSPSSTSTNKPASKSKVALCLFAFLVFLRYCATSEGNVGPTSSRSRQMGQVLSAVVKEEPSSSQICSRTSAEFACKQPGHDGCGSPSALSVKFLVSSGVSDSKVMVKQRSQI